MTNILFEIEKKRAILEDLLSRNDIDLKHNEILEISKELDELIVKYTNELKTKSSKK